MSSSVTLHFDLCSADSCVVILRIVMRVTKDVPRKSVKFCFNSFTILSLLINRNFVVTLDQFFDRPLLHFGLGWLNF